MCPQASAGASSRRIGNPATTVRPALGDRPPPPPPRRRAARRARRAPPAVRGDELSDAKARQAQLKKDVAAQKAQVAQLDALQVARPQDIKQTTRPAKGINADLAAVKVKITDMAGQDRRRQGALRRPRRAARRARRAARRCPGAGRCQGGELAERKALLAERVRSAYDTDRTSLLESFLSGGSFTDLLTEMSYYIDVGEQDKALADQIARTRRRSPRSTRRPSTRARGPTTCASRRPPRSVPSTRAWPTSTTPRPRSRSSRSETAKALASQKRDYADARQRTRPPPRRRWPRPPPRRRSSRTRSPRSSASRCRAATSRRSTTGRCRWPMTRRRHPALRLHRVLVGAATGLVRPLPPGHRPRRAVRHAGQGVRRRDDRLHRLELRRRRRTRPGSSSSPTAQGLQTWYAHMQPRYPGGIHAGSHVKQGQVIGYEGNTGPLDRRAPPLGGHAQRRLRQPAAVPLGHARGLHGVRHRTER